MVATYPYEVNLRADLQILRAVRDAAGEIPLSALELLKEVGLLRRNDQAFSALMRQLFMMYGSRGIGCGMKIMHKPGRRWAT
ncbi:hypothetical protein MASR2M15_29120 [Anaerolineales bacterium]